MKCIGCGWKPHLNADLAHLPHCVATGYLMAMAKSDPSGFTSFMAGTNALGSIFGKDSI